MTFPPDWGVFSRVFFVVFPVFTVSNDSRYCVVCPHDNPADGSYLHDNFATEAEALDCAAAFNGRVVYSPVLDLLKSL